MIKKVFIPIMILALLAGIGYYEFSPEVLDSRAVLDNGVEQVKKANNLTPEQEQILRVQLAISDYMASTGKAPDSLSELVPKYFDNVPLDPNSGKPLEYAKVGNKPKLGGQVQMASASSRSGDDKEGVSSGGFMDTFSDATFINPNTMQIEDFVYDPTGKRDPFEAFDLSPKANDKAATPLESFDLGQLKLTAVMVSPNGTLKGVVEDARGHGYTVSVGTKIGNAQGVVVEILKDKLKVVETKVDFTGKETQTPVEMPIRSDAERKAADAKRSNYEKGNKNSRSKSKR